MAKLKDLPFCAPPHCASLETSLSGIAGIALSGIAVQFQCREVGSCAAKMQFGFQEKGKAQITHRSTLCARNWKYTTLQYKESGKVSDRKPL